MDAPPRDPLSQFIVSHHRVSALFESKMGGKGKFSLDRACATDLNSSLEQKASKPLMQFSCNVILTNP